MAKLKFRSSKLNLLVVAAAVAIITRALVSSFVDNESVVDVIEIISNITTGLCLILYAALVREETSILARLALIIEGLSWGALPFAPDHKTYFLFYTVILWSCAILLCLSCIAPFGNKEGRAVVSVGASFTMLDYLPYLSGNHYEHVENPGNIHFLLPSILITVAITGIAVILLLKDKIPLKKEKNNTKGTKVAIVILVIMASFGLCWPTFDHLNFALDTSEPEVYEEVILEKTRTSGKSPNFYLHMEINGERRKIDVSRSMYEQYEEGDTFEIHCYEGAFDDPFYTYLG